MSNADQEGRFTNPAQTAPDPLPLPPNDPPGGTPPAPEPPPVQPPPDGLPGEAPPRPIGDPPSEAPIRLALPPEIGGPKGPEPTRYGDWEQKGRVTDF